MITNVPHRPGGRFYGFFHFFPSGKGIYMAHRSGNDKKGYYRKANAWCVDNDTLRACQSRGIESIGIRWRSGSRVFYYVTNVEDFFGPKSERHYVGDTPQRRLNREDFLVKKARVKVRGAGYKLVPIEEVLIPIR